MIETRAAIVWLCSAVVGAAVGACTVSNPDHCGNRNVDATCREAYPDTPYCDLCAAQNDGCVDQAPQGDCAPETGSGSGTVDDGTDGATGTTAGDTAATVTGSGSGSSGDTGPVCGDDTKDAGEACDGQDLDDLDCAGLGYAGGTLSCREDCRFDPTGCQGFEDCNDGAIDPGEECDTDDVGGATCASLPAYSGGTLQCDDQCRFNTTQCVACFSTGETCESDEECCEGSCVGAVAKACL